MALGSEQKGAKYLAAEGEAAAEVAQQPAAAPPATSGAAAGSSPAGSFRKPKKPRRMIELSTLVSEQGASL